MARREKVQNLKSRVSADPCDAAGWESLLAEITRGRKSQEQYVQLKQVYEDIVTKFPTANAYWREYCELEMDNGTPEATKSLFSRCLLRCLDVDLWRAYLRFIRKLNDPRGVEGLPEIRQAMEFALDHVGQDLRSGPIWQEYILFLNEAKPGTSEHEILFGKGPEGQEDAQRIAVLRRAYHRSLLVPSAALDNLWIGYERFESSTGNKTLAKRSLDEWRPKYQAARSQLGERTRLVERLDMRALPVPPGRGGPRQARQAVAWREYLAWERTNVQELDVGIRQARVVLAYEQCLTVLMQFPDVWLDFAYWHCGPSGVGKEAAAAVLHRGRMALPTSLALHFATSEMEESLGAVDKAREIFEELIGKLTAVSTPSGNPKVESPLPGPENDVSKNTDPALSSQATADAQKKSKEEEETKTEEEQQGQDQQDKNEENEADSRPNSSEEQGHAEEADDGPDKEDVEMVTGAKEDGDDDSKISEDSDGSASGQDAPIDKTETVEEASPGTKDDEASPKQENEVKSNQPDTPGEAAPEKEAPFTAPDPPKMFSDTDGTLIWIQYMRFCRRSDGMMAARKLFLRARKWPGLQWHAFAASAALEWAHEAKDQIPRNIFELGLKTHMEQPAFVLEYARFLRGLGDVANCRALFERALTAVSASVAAPLWDAYVQFEAEVGTLGKVASVESRRREALQEEKGMDSGTDAMRTAVLKYRFLDLWPGSEYYLRSILSDAEVAVATGMPAGGEEIDQGPSRSGVSVSDGGPESVGLDVQDRRPEVRRRYPAQMRPAFGRGRYGAAFGPSAEQQRSFPRELGLLLNQVNSMPLHGPVPDVERVLEVILRADFSPEGIEAHEAAAARERRRQRHQTSDRQMGSAGGPVGQAGGPAGIKRKAGYEASLAPILAPESDTESSDEEDDEDELAETLDVYRKRMRSRA